MGTYETLLEEVGEPMISLLAALEGICTIWKNDGSEQRVAFTADYYFYRVNGG